MKGMIFAAGLGTRLRPLTNNIPKALIKIGDITLLEFAIRKLLLYGFNDLIINVHYYPDQIIDFLKANNNFGADITISDERDILLDTGGGLKKASPLLSGNDPFLIYNCDIVTNLDLLELYSYHIENGGLCTLAVRKRDTYRYFLFDKKNNLCGWWNKKTAELKPPGLRKENLIAKAFSGIQIVSPKLFNLFPKESIFSIIDFYMMIAQRNEIKGYDHSEDFWTDIGTIIELEKMQGIKELFSYF
jgi:NDP-sugar pyrophosphorylase family protein